MGVGGGPLRPIGGREGGGLAEGAVDSGLGREGEGDSGGGDERIRGCHRTQGYGGDVAKRVARNTF